MVHPAIAEQVAGVIDDGNGYGTVGLLDGLIQHSIHGPAVWSRLSRGFWYIPHLQ